MEPSPLLASPGTLLRPRHRSYSGEEPEFVPETKPAVAGRQHSPPGSSARQGSGFADGGGDTNLKEEAAALVKSWLRPRYDRQELTREQYKAVLSSAVRDVYLEGRRRGQPPTEAAAQAAAGRALRALVP
jgi:hypothetical protein